MGEAKRRKKLDVNYGKIPRKSIQDSLPTSVPQDYLRYNNFKPCFGYVYVVQFQDINPCLFIVKKEFILLVKNTFSFGFNQGLVTVEMDVKTTKQFLEILRNENDEIKFVAYPNYRKRYKDNHGLSVIPFNIKYFVNDISETDINRTFLVT